MKYKMKGEAFLAALSVIAIISILIGGGATFFSEKRHHQNHDVVHETHDENLTIDQK